MKRVLLLAFGCLIALPTLTLGQDSVYHQFFLKQPVYRPGQVIPAKDVSQLIDVEIPANKSYRIVEVAYDTTWSTTDYNNNSSAITYSAGWAVGGNAAKFYNSDFHYASGTAPRTATFVVNCDKPCKLGFWSERFLETWGPHGAYQLKIDAGTAVTINAGVGTQISDKDRAKPSYRSPLLPIGSHTLLISGSAQFVVDNISVSKATITIKP